MTTYCIYYIIVLQNPAVQIYDSNKVPPAAYLHCVHITWSGMVWRTAPKSIKLLEVKDSNQNHSLLLQLANFRIKAVYQICTEPEPQSRYKHTSLRLLQKTDDATLRMMHLWRFSQLLCWDCFYGDGWSTAVTVTGTLYNSISVFKH